MNHSIHTINQDFVDRRNERVVINIIPRDWVEMVEKRYCVERGLNRCGREGKEGEGEVDAGYAWDADGRQRGWCSIKFPIVFGGRIGFQWGRN